MSSLCDCLMYAFGGPVSDPANCSEERGRVDAWHAYQAYHPSEAPWEDRPPRLQEACGDERPAGPTGVAATAPVCRRGSAPPIEPLTRSHMKGNYCTHEGELHTCREFG